jgi:hypothetical protein
MEKETNKTVKKVATDIAVDAMNLVPLVGTLVRSVVNLIQSRTEDNLSAYVRGALDGKEILDSSFPESDCFLKLAELVARDVHSDKALYYANAFRFIKYLEGQNRPIVDFLLEVIPDLTAMDFRFIQELRVVLDVHKRQGDESLAEAIERFYLKRKDGANVSRLWYHQRSLRKLEALGILIQHPTRGLPWPGEHFDVIACVANGVDLEGAPLAERRNQ